MFLSIVNLFLLTVIYSINGQCTQSGCTAQSVGSTCCFHIGCCPSSSNVCCSNDRTNCCSTQFPICCGDGKGCCRRDHPVCCTTHCCPSHSYCCGKKCCRQQKLTGHLVEINDQISKMNQYQKIMMDIHHS